MTPSPDEHPSGTASGIRRRRVASVLIALAVSAAVAACGSSSSKSSSSSSSAGAAASGSAQAASGAGPTLNVGDQAGDGAQALLTAAGLLHALPFHVKFDDFTSGPPILEAMNGGSVDIAQVGDAPPVFSAAGGAKIVLVGAVDDNPASAALVLAKGSSITSPKQLKGKKIAVAEGSSADYYLLDMLERNGLSVHDVTLVNLQPPQALAALTSGAVDAWATWSPFIEEAVAKDGARILANGSHYGSNYSYQVASAAAVANPAKSKEIAEYLTTINKAHRWANAHPAAWAAIWAKATGLPQSIMVTAAKDDWSHPKPVNAQTGTSEQGLVDAFYKAGLIPKQFGFSKYVTSKYAGSVG
jgi:sulfonate transport system substrate-binding protein